MALNEWNTSSVTNMYRMFVSTSFNQSLNEWDVSSVKNMERMFKNALKFEQDISCWNVADVSANPPYQFDDNSGFEGETDKQPLWGTSGC